MWTHKILPAVTFFAVANPETFKLVRSLAGDWVASSYGVPTTYGLILHSIVFVILLHFLWVLMYGPKKRSSGYMAQDIKSKMSLTF
jgi:hypothetical protein